MQACDCHVHVFDPQRFPYATDRSYTPGAATVEALTSFHAGLGVERVVLVQPSVYGSDNACLLAALRALGTARARGIAVVDLEHVTHAELHHLHAGGVRGLRLNLEVRGEADVAAAREQLAMARCVADLPGWCLQVYASAELNLALADELAAFPVPVVLDHFGGLRDLHCQQDLLALTGSKSVYVKASAAYKLAEPEAAGELVKAFYAVAPTRLLWGSDWPHTGGGAAARRSPPEIEPFRVVDDAAALEAIRDALPGDAARHQVLVDNPARLYGFA